MTYLKIAGATVALATLVAAPSAARADFCIAQYDPVCGGDGELYSNACYAADAGTSPQTGGALIELLDPSGSFFFWSTNDAFIDEAIAIVDGISPQRIPVFNDLFAGDWCSEPHLFHVDPYDMAFADVTIELCDGTAAYIDENRDEWLQQVDQWCPWSAQIVAVYDER